MVSPVIAWLLCLLRCFFAYSVACPVVAYVVESVGSPVLCARSMVLCARSLVVARRLSGLCCAASLWSLLRDISLVVPRLRSGWSLALPGSVRDFSACLFGFVRGFSSFVLVSLELGAVLSDCCGASLVVASSLCLLRAFLTFC